MTILKKGCHKKNGKSEKSKTNTGGKNCEI
jgi:hypothetical protein